MLCEHIRIGAATLDTYLLERISGVAATQARPCVLVLPGGGYHHLSAREAEPVALRFCGAGLHVCVLRYSVAPACWPQALVETAAAVALLRAHASEWGTDPNRIVVTGFSAGGHLAGCLGAFWREGWLAAAASGLLREAGNQETPTGGSWHLDSDDVRPNAFVLGYPVITSGEFAHRGSFENLCGQGGKPLAGDAPANLGATAAAGLIQELSLEKRVGDAWPPTFLWHTFDDQSVPVENSLLLAAALHAVGVPAELHIFPHGSHGSALGTPETAMDKYGTLETDPATGRAVSLGNDQIQPDTIATWPDLALRWLRNLA